MCWTYVQRGNECIACELWMPIFYGFRHARRWHTVNPPIKSLICNSKRMRHFAPPLPPYGGPKNYSFFPTFFKTSYRREVNHLLSQHRYACSSCWKYQFLFPNFLLAPKVYRPPFKLKLGVVIRWWLQLHERGGIDNGYMSAIRKEGNWFG